MAGERALRGALKVDVPRAKPPRTIEAPDSPVYRVVPDLNTHLPDVGSSQAHLFREPIQNMWTIMNRNPGANDEFIGYVTPRQWERFVGNLDDPLVSKTRAADHSADILEGRGLGTFVSINAKLSDDGGVLFSSAEGSAVMRALAEADALDAPVPVVFKLDPLGDFDANAVTPVTFSGLEETEMFHIPHFREKRKLIRRSARTDPREPAPTQFQARNAEEFTDLKEAVFSPERGAFSRIVRTRRNLGADDIEIGQALNREIAASADSVGARQLRSGTVEIEAKHVEALRDNGLLLADQTTITGTRPRSFVAGASIYTRALLGETSAKSKDLPLIITRIERQQANFPTKGMMRNPDTGNFIVDDFPNELGTHAAFSREQSNALRLEPARQRQAIKQFRQTEETFKETFPDVDLAKLFGDAYEDALTISDVGTVRRVSFSTQEFEESVIRRLSTQGEFLATRTTDEGITRVWSEVLAIQHQKVSQEIERAFIWKGKGQGYLTVDEGIFTPGTMAERLLNDPVFSKHSVQLEHIRARATVDGGFDPNHDLFTKRLHSIMEQEGYDHILYINNVENPGVPSIISWRPDLLEELSPGPRGGYSLENFRRLVTAFAGIGAGATALLEEQE